MTKRIAIVLCMAILMTIASCQAPRVQVEIQETESAQVEYQFVGSINSDIYHCPDCIWAHKIKPNNEIWFKDAEETRNYGYRPCRVCNP